MLKGVYTALITPFLNGRLDLVSFKKLVQNQINDGVDGFVINGTTGESPNLSFDEIEAMVNTARELIPARLKIIIGTGSNSTQKTIEFSQLVEKKLKPDALLVVVPYYNKPPQRGLVKHFTLIAQSCKTPIILYNVPGRTITSLDIESIVELAKVSNIIGIKEATGNTEFAAEIRKRTHPTFCLLSGDDGTYEAFLAAGGDGIISVASHIIPKAFINGNISQFKFLIESLYTEANPIPVKRALQLMGTIQSAELRSPLIEHHEKYTPALKTLLKEAGVGVS
jgi:4-hydroxy-tetrahydrodipicolinate synthase